MSDAPGGDDPKPSSVIHVIGAALLAIAGASASFVDDCARAGSHLGGTMDDVGRLGAHADDLGAHADDLGAAISDDLLGDLAELGLDAADLALAASDALSDPAADTDADPTRPAAEPAARPRLVVAGVPRSPSEGPSEGPADPLVLLVTDADRSRVARLARGCTTWEHACIVLACPPGRLGCVEGWKATWAALSTDEAMVGHPEIVADALVASPHGRPELGTRLTVGRLTTLGFSVYEHEIR